MRDTAKEKTAFFRTLFMSVLALVLVTGSAWASPYGGGRNDGAGGVEGQGEVAPGRGKIEVTQAKLIFMSRYQLKNLVDEIGYDYSRLKVEGFSDAMNTWLSQGLTSHPVRMRSLIRDMSEIKDEDKRKARLDEAVRELDRIIEVLENSEWEGYEALNRLNRFRRLRDTVEVWSRYPEEGTR